MTLMDPNPVFKVTAFLKSNISKTVHLRDKVTIAQEETVPNIWNATMFVDLDWPLNASRGFVSISWASCLKWYYYLFGFCLVGLFFCKLLHTELGISQLFKNPTQNFWTNPTHWSLYLTQPNLAYSRDHVTAVCKSCFFQLRQQPPHPQLLDYGFSQDLSTPSSSAA